MTSKATFSADIPRSLVNAAFDRMENGLAVFVSHEEANAQMADFKAETRARNKSL